MTIDLLDDAGDDVGGSTSVEACRLAELAAVELSELSVKIAATLAEMASETEAAAADVETLPGTGESSTDTGRSDR